MKSIIIIIIIVLFITLKSFGQAPHPPCSFNSHPELDKFVGTWLWVLGTDTLELKLYKQAIHFPSPLDYEEECLVGWHRYVKNSNAVESSFQYAGQAFFGGNSTVFGWNQSPIKLYGNLNDLTKDKHCDLYLTMTDNTYVQMIWKLMESRGMKLPNFQYGFTLPTNLVLTKQ